IPNAVYVIVGSGVYENELRVAVEKFGVKDKVLFVTDAVDNDLPLFYQSCDLFAMPCRELANGDVEGFGIVYLEANLFGKPVVAGRSGGAAEAVIDGQTGLVVEPNDANAIAEALVALLTDEQRAKILGEAGRKRVVEQFDWKKQADKVRQLLR
ncbi:MAG: glycosyltransferase family 4 protein, partial [Parcubacteria group bacterium]